MESPIIQDYSNPQQGSDMMAASPGNVQNNGESPARKAFTRMAPTRRDDRKIFVGGLPSNVTDEEFHAFFSQFGTVLDSVVMFDRETRRSRGFGFVTYEDPNVVRLLLEMRVDGTDGCGRVEMRGKVCEIKAAQPKESNYAGRGRRGSSNTNKGYPSRYPPQQQPVYPANGQAYGYPPSSPEVTSQVNRGVPSSLPMSSGHAAMYSHYGMGAYYPPQATAGMNAAAYSHYMTGYAPDGSYYEQGNHAEHPAYASGAMAVPHADSNGAYAAGYGSTAFVPVEDANQSAGKADEQESSQGISNGEEAKQN